MAITINATPMVLSWTDFTTVSHKITDPADGSLVDAFTSFDFNIPDLPPRSVNGTLKLADPMTITITPRAQVWSGVAKTIALLAHEQFHYDVGIVTGRALARHLMRISGNDVASLRAALLKAVELHFTTRTGLLQRRYDLDTRHGANAHYQNIWKGRMSNCLSQPRSNQLGGFFL